MLKGPNAAALYGSRAANGVILITTKKGSKAPARRPSRRAYTWDRPSILPELPEPVRPGLGRRVQVRRRRGRRRAGRQRPELRSRGSTAAPWAATSSTEWSTERSARYDQTRRATSSTRRTAVRGSRTRTTSRASSTRARPRDGNIAFTGGTDKRAPVSRSAARTSTASSRTTFLRKVDGARQRLARRQRARLTTNGSVKYIRNDGRRTARASATTRGILEQFVWFGRQVDMNALKNCQQRDQLNGGTATASSTGTTTTTTTRTGCSTRTRRRTSRDRVDRQRLGARTSSPTGSTPRCARVRTSTATTSTSSFAQGNSELRRSRRTPARSPTCDDVNNENNTDALLHGEPSSRRARSS